MKTLIILILAVALLAVAYFTRPSQASFSDMMTQASSEQSASASARDLKYVDHYLWVTVERDGKAIYVGAFSHWFDVGQGKKAIHGEGTASAGGWYSEIGA